MGVPAEVVAGPGAEVDPAESHGGDLVAVGPGESLVGGPAVEGDHGEVGWA